MLEALLKAVLMAVMAGMAASLGVIVLRVLVRAIAQQHPVSQRLKRHRKRDTVTVGFFHPYCNAGGGGERVLWAAINSLHERHSNVHCVVYTGDVDATEDTILATVKQRFGMQVDRSRTSFVFLSRRDWVEARCYPNLTMILQSLGSMVLGWEALTSFVPDVYLDTMGYAFTLPLFRIIGGCKVGCYVHYPTVSTDMLQRVKSGEASFNNADDVSKSSFKTSLKVLYYRAFAVLYGVMGLAAKVVMVNSSWTSGHIRKLWGREHRVRTVFPPCDTVALTTLELAKRSNEIVSVAQFRPEKNHALQLEAMQKLVEEDPQLRGKLKLYLVGGCRNEGDERRVADLKALASRLNVEDVVEFRLNVSYDELKKRLRNAKIGLHTMRDEHFGIGVVEFMAAGAVPVAHNSAGPKQDIVVPFKGQQTGFLADDAVSYADAIRSVLNMPPKDFLAMQEAARASVRERFSEASFKAAFAEAVEPLIVS